jgi:hypothetical protein
MPRLPPRDEKVARLESLEHGPSRFLESALVAELDSGERLDLGLVGRRRRRPLESRQIVAAVHGDHGPPGAGRLEHGVEDARRDRAVAVVGDEEGVRAPSRPLHRGHQGIFHGVRDGRLGLAVEADHLLAGGLVAAGHDCVS